MFRSKSERVRFVDSGDEEEEEDEERVAPVFRGAGGMQPKQDDSSSSDDGSVSSEESEGEGSGSNSGISGSDDDDDDDANDNPFDNPFASPPANEFPASGTGTTSSFSSSKNRRFGRRFNPWAKKRPKADDGDDDGGDNFHDEPVVRRHRKTKSFDPAILEEQKKVRFWLYGCSALLLGLIIMVVLLVVLLMDNGDGNDSNSSNKNSHGAPSVPAHATTAPQPTIAPSAMAPTVAAPQWVSNHPLYQLIASNMVDGGASISIEGSPQQIAFSWIQNEDILSNPPQSRHNRHHHRSLDTEPISHERQIQRFRLVAFFEATNGNDWNVKTRWKSGVDSECTWHGITCHPTSQIVIGLHFFQNKVDGPLIPELGQLTTLTTLVIINSGTAQKLTGNLNLLKNLVSLDKIQITGNDFSSSKEPEYDDIFAQWNKISRVDLSGNQWKGPIPTSVKLLTTTTSLDLSRNQFSGPILPEILRDLKDLRVLNLAENHLSDHLPEALNSSSIMSKLETLNISHNSLMGNLLTMTGGAVSVNATSYMGSLNLKVMDVSHNDFSGPMPSYMFQVLGKLEVLRINNNQFSGILPDMSGLQYIRDMDVSNNPLLKGNIPQTPICQRIQSGMTNLAIADCPGIVASCNEAERVCCSCCTCNSLP